MAREFKFYPQDFGERGVKVIHMDLFFDIYDDHTVVNSKLKLKVLDKVISQIELNAKDLKINSIKGDGFELDFEYKKKENIILIKFKEEMECGREFIIITDTVCRPTHNILEGLYYDQTPKDCPPTQITQCQEWGFQRIVPCIDDMTAKCTYITTIHADSRYTNIITNGDVKVDRHSVGEGRDEIVYENIITPMAPYLFFLGVGTYDTFKKEVEYPNGKKFMLELLVPPGSDKVQANHALDILHDGIIWINLFTGKDKYENHDDSLKVWELIKKREILKKEVKGGVDIDNIRKKIMELVFDKQLGYEYTGTVYREIGMQNSNFGGMENVGNTTITTNRIIPFKEITDGAFEYMIRVKVHEFYHNLNGSEVTGYTPFEFWLNEAVTVFIEKQYYSFLFSEEYVRLSTVLGLLSPIGGTLRDDESVSVMPIKPKGFNDPNELVTSVTYVKSPEIVRMVRSFMGKENFVKALAVYHKDFSHSNAKTEDWIEYMNKRSSFDLKPMIETWINNTGYPNVFVSKNFSDGNMVVDIKQEHNLGGVVNFEFPFILAAVDKQGNVIEEKLLHVKDEKENAIFENVSEDNLGYLSVNRGYCFYGKVFFDSNNDELYLQARTDDDLISRYLAFYKLSDIEKMNVIEGKDVSERFIDLYIELLEDENLMRRGGGQFIAIFESVECEKYSHMYQTLYDSKNKILFKIAKKYKERLLKLYEKYSEEKSDGTYMENQVYNIMNRQIKNIVLSLLSKIESDEVYEMIKKQYYQSENYTDKITAFSLYLNSKSDDKMELFDDLYNIAKDNLVVWEIFLGVVAGNDSEDYLDLIKKVESLDEFRIEQSNDQRSLFVRFSMNKKKSLETKKGREYLEYVLNRLSSINEYHTMHILESFSYIDKMEEKYHVFLMKILVELFKKLDFEKTPSVYNTVKRIINNSYKARENYEKEFGKIIID